MNSLLDDVNALLKLKQGDLGRLEHIKKTLEEGNMLYISDSKYLQELTKEYLKTDTDKIIKKTNPYDYPEYANRMKDTAAKNEHLSSNNYEVKAEKVEETLVKKVEHMENVFCWKCGTKNLDYAQFCNYCGSSIHNVKTERTSVSSKIYSPKHTSEVKKVRKRLVILGFIILIFSSGVFVVPIRDNGFTVADVNALCKSGLGLIGQSFNQQVQASCAQASQLILLASILVIIGIIVIALGFIKKNTNPLGFYINKIPYLYYPPIAFEFSDNHQGWKYWLDHVRGY